MRTHLIPRRGRRRSVVVLPRPLGRPRGLRLDPRDAEPVGRIDHQNVGVDDVGGVLARRRQVVVDGDLRVRVENGSLFRNQN